MSFFEIVIIGICLACDAFAVSICKGLSLSKKSIKNSIIVAGYFGIFQSIMPLLGYLIGYKYEYLVKNLDHWIIFGLLLFIGLDMLSEAKNKDLNQYKNDLDVKEMISLSIATSIDAFAVGVTFAFLKVMILRSVLIIGIITFIICYIGTSIGNKLGIKYKNKAQMVGGLILIFIGIKILLQHLI